MDTNNWRPNAPNGEPTMDTADWRTQLQPDSRQRIVNKIMETLRRHLPCSGDEGLNELRKIAVRFEEKIYTAATSQSDYLRRISLKMLTMETKSQSTLPNPGNSSKPPDPASLDSTAQTGHGDDWQEEVFQKIKSMRDMYLGELNDMNQKITAKMQQCESMQQPRPEQFDKLKIFKAMLEQIVAFISVSSKENITLKHKEKLGSYEKQMVHFLTTNRPRKPAQQGQLPVPHMQPITQPQPQPQLSQVQSHDNQMNPQLQSVNMQGSMQTMQQNNLSNLQHNSLTSLPGVSSAQQSILSSLQPSSNMDLGQGAALSTLQQVAVGSLQQNPVSAPQQANINTLSSQSGVNVLQPNINPLQPNPNCYS